MKKQLIGILAFCMTALCFTGCGLFGDNSSANYDVEMAADWAYAHYMELNEETRVDYTVSNTIAYGGVDYALTWSVDVTEGVVVVRGETETTIDVNEALTADLAYVLKAVVTAPNGDTEEIEFDRVVLAAPAYVPEAITAKPATEKAYKLYVYQSTKNADCYFNGKMSGFYYGTSETYEEGVDVYAEYKEGSETEFYLYFEAALTGKQYLTIEEGWNSNSSHWTFNPIITNEATTTFEYNEEYKTIVATIFARSNDNYSNKDAQPDTNTVVYLGNYSTYMTFSVSDISYLGGAGNNVGNLVEMVNKASVSNADKLAFEKDALTVPTAYVGNNTVELSTLGDRYTDVVITWAEESDNLSIANGVLTVTAPTAETTATLTATLTCGGETVTKEFTLTLSGADLSTPAGIVEAAYALAAGQSLDGTHTLTGVITSVDTAYDSGYENVTVTIVIGNMTEKPIKCYRMKGTGADVIKAGDTITVSGTLTNYNGTIEFTAGCTLDSYVAGEGGDVTPPVVEDTTAVATFEFGENGEAKHVDGSYNELTTDTTYTVNGYTLTLTGMTKVFGYNPTSDSGTATDAKGNSCLKLGTGSLTASLTFTVADEVKSVAINVAQYKANATKITVNGTEYEIKTASNDGAYTTIKVNTATTKTVTVATVSGTQRAMINSIAFYDVECENTPATGNGDVTPPVGGDEPTVTPTTPEEILNALYALADGESLSGEFTLTGKITELDSYKNPTIVVEGFESKPVYCYYLSVDNAVGDTITVTAKGMKNYQGTYEFTNCTLVSSEAGGDTPATPTTPAEIVDAAYALASGAAMEGTYTLSGKITKLGDWNTQYNDVNVTFVVEGKEDKPMYCYGLKGATQGQLAVGDTITVTGSIKNYNGTVEFDKPNLDSHIPAEGGEVTPPVDGGETPDVGGEDGQTVTASKTIEALITSEGWTSSTTKQEFALDSVVSVKVDGGSNSGKAYEGNHIRIYATDTPAGSLTITLASGYELVSVKVTTVEGTYAFLCVGDGTEDISNTTTTVSGSSVVLNAVKNGTDGKQVRVLAIEVVYKAV